MKSKKSQLIVCVGAGGVGKTTVSSVLGFFHAAQGKKTLVVTIDPAQRLLDIMGLNSHSSQPVKVSTSQGELYAFMPDLKKEWLDFISSSLGKGAKAIKISSNHFYQYMADGLPGALEIICSHIVYRLMESNTYDFIILDTPPSSHSLAFFDVPKKINRVLEQNLFQALIASRHSMLFKLTRKLALLSSGMLEKSLEKILGSHFFSEIIDFALIIDGLYEPMLIRTKAMEALLTANTTKFVVVCRPNSASINDIQLLHQALEQRGITASQLVINQLLFDPGLSLPKERRELITSFEKDELGRRCEEIVLMFNDDYNYQQKLIKRIEHEFNNIIITKLRKASQHEAIDLLTSLLSDYQNCN